MKETDQTIEPETHHVLATGATFGPEFINLLSPFGYSEQMIQQAVEHVMSFKHEDNADTNLTWLCLIDLEQDDDITYFAFRYVRYLPKPGWTDTDGLRRFSLSQEFGFEVRSSLFREPLTRAQIIGPSVKQNA